MGSLAVYETEGVEQWHTCLTLVTGNALYAENTLNAALNTVTGGRKPEAHSITFAVITA